MTPAELLIINKYPPNPNLSKLQLCITRLIITPKLKTNPSLSKLFRIEWYPTLKFIKNERVYDYTGPRDERSIKYFISQGYQDSKYGSIPTDLPTFFETFANVFSQIAREITAIFKSGNKMAIGLVSFLFGIVFILIGAIVWLSCCDPFKKPARQSSRNSSGGSTKRSLKRESKKKEVNLDVKESDVKNSSGKDSQGTEGVTKRNRSSRRREE